MTAELFARLRRAHELLDPNLIGSGAPSSGAVAALRELYDAAAGSLTLDWSWSLMDPKDASRTKRDMVGDWNSDWEPFASDACGGVLLLEAASGKVIFHGSDPPTQKVVAANLNEWLVELVERMEAQARSLPPNHKLNLALLAAVERSDSDAARHALDEGADPNAQDHIPGTALLYAAERPNGFELVHLLLDRGADASLPSWKPPIFGAIERANLRAVEILLDHGVDANQRESYYGQTPLIVAARYAKKGGSRILTLLVRRGADVNARTVLGSGVNSDTRVGETALIVAAQCDSLEALAILLGSGADPNIADEFWGNTPLFHGIRRRNREVIESLLNAGADPNRVNKRGERPLQVALDQYNGIRRVPIDEGIVQRLRERGAL